MIRLKSKIKLGIAFLKTDSVTCINVLHCTFLEYKIKLSWGASNDLNSRVCDKRYPSPPTWYFPFIHPELTSLHELWCRGTEQLTWADTSYGTYARVSGETYLQRFSEELCIACELWVMTLVSLMAQSLHFRQLFLAQTERTLNVRDFSDRAIEVLNPSTEMCFQWHDSHNT